MISNKLACLPNKYKCKVIKQATSLYGSTQLTKVSEQVVQMCMNINVQKAEESHREKFTRNDYVLSDIFYWIENLLFTIIEILIICYLCIYAIGNKTLANTCNKC